jgi:hypothetical protein
LQLLLSKEENSTVMLLENIGYSTKYQWNNQKYNKIQRTSYNSLTFIVSIGEKNIVR